MEKMDDNRNQGVGKTSEPSARVRRSNRREMYLVICNISKRANVRQLLAVAVAFGCRGVLVVGQKGFDFDPKGSDVPPKLSGCISVDGEAESGYEGALAVTRFRKWDECVDYLRERDIRLVGVEIHADAQPIEAYLDEESEPTRDIAFLMGNEGQGVQEKQMKSCDGFVRIPQYGAGTASLNVYVAASIVLHRYHEWQRRTFGFDESSQE